MKKRFWMDLAGISLLLLAIVAIGSVDLGNSATLYGLPMGLLMLGNGVSLISYKPAKKVRRAQAPARTVRVAGSNAVAYHRAA